MRRWKIFLRPILFSHGSSVLKSSLQTFLHYARVLEAQQSQMQSTGILIHCLIDGLRSCKIWQILLGSFFTLLKNELISNINYKWIWETKSDFSKKLFSKISLALKFDKEKFLIFQKMSLETKKLLKYVISIQTSIWSKSTK